MPQKYLQKNELAFPLYFLTIPQIFFDKWNWNKLKISMGLSSIKIVFWSNKFIGSKPVPL